MSYRLIDANALAPNHKEVNDMPCIYADLPNGLDGNHYIIQDADMVDVLIELLKIKCLKLHEDVGKSRWHELFGTPERAARTIAAMMDKCSDRPHGCDGCLLFDVCDDEMVALEWLKQEVDA